MGLFKHPLSLDDLYLTDEPIALRARLIGLSDSAPRKLKAEIQQVSGASSTEQSALTFNFVGQERESVLTIGDLPAGLYRVKVQAENLGDQAPTPVHDVFEVVKT